MEPRYFIKSFDETIWLKKMKLFHKNIEVSYSKTNDSKYALLSPMSIPAFSFFSLKKNHKCIWIDSCLVLLSMLLFVIENIQIYVQSCTGALIFLDSRTVDDPIPVPVPLVFYPYSVPVPHFWN